METSKSKSLPVMIIQFYKDCWIYPYYSERLKIKKILTLLKEKGNMTFSELNKEFPTCHNSIIRSIIYILVGIKVLRIKSYKNYKVVLLNKSWEKQFKRHVVFKERNETLY